MSLPVVLDVAIGLIGLYLALSLLASSLLEFYSAALNRPGKILQWGIGHLLSDPTRQGLAQDFYEHPLIRGLSGLRKPSRIEPMTAAKVLVDLMDKAGVFEGAQANNVLAPFVDLVAKMEGDMKQNLLQPIADWYREGVERLSGVAARRSQLLLFFLGLVIAAGSNINTIKITEALFAQDALREIGVAAAKKAFADHPELAQPDKPADASKCTEDPAVCDAQEDQALRESKAKADKFKDDFLKTYGGFPIGWEGVKNRCDAFANWGWLGMLLTAIAISMGAQFWYRILGGLLKLRGGATEPAPDTKKGQ